MGYNLIVTCTHTDGNTVDPLIGESFSFSKFLLAGKGRMRP